eukprot:2815015-Lingulodinium_polyedra.AAC.1
MRPTVTMVEDGRARRMKENVRKDIGNMTEQVSAAVDLSSIADEEHALGRGKTFRQALQKASSEHADILRKVKVVQRRIETS